MRVGDLVRSKATGTERLVRWVDEYAAWRMLEDGSIRPFAFNWSGWDVVGHEDVEPVDPGYTSGELLAAEALNSLRVFGDGEVREVRIDVVVVALNAITSGTDQVH